MQISQIHLTIFIPVLKNMFFLEIFLSLESPSHLTVILSSVSNVLEIFKTCKLQEGRNLKIQFVGARCITVLTSGVLHHIFKISLD
jgi:hypothetical protein